VRTSALADAAVKVGGRTLWSGVDLSVGSGSSWRCSAPTGVGKSTLVRRSPGTAAPGPPAPSPCSTTDRANTTIGSGTCRNAAASTRRLRIRASTRAPRDQRGPVRHPLPVSAPGSAAPTRRGGADQRGHRPRRCHRPRASPHRGTVRRRAAAHPHRAGLVRRPALLLLDEPLDQPRPPQPELGGGLVSTICRQAEVSVVMVAHDVNPILSYLDRVGLHRRKGGVAAGTPGRSHHERNAESPVRTPIEVLTTTDGRLVVVGHPEAPAHHADRHGGVAHGAH